MKKRKTIQQILMVCLFYVFIFANDKPLVITAYITLCFHFLTLFADIFYKENERKNEDQRLPQIIFSIALQLFSIGMVYGLSWYLFERKL